MSEHENYTDDEEYLKEDHIIKTPEGHKRARRQNVKPPSRWEHPDEGAVLKKSKHFDEDAVEEAARSDTEIPQTDDEEDEVELSEDEDDMSLDEAEDGDWAEDDTEDDDESSEEEEDEEEIAVALLIRVNSKGRFIFDAYDSDGLVLETSTDYTYRERPLVLASIVSPDTTRVVCQTAEETQVFYDAMAAESEIWEKFDKSAFVDKVSLPQLYKGPLRKEVKRFFQLK